MNAFISYSIGANEQYILNLLAQKMEKIGLNLITSYENPSLWVYKQTPTIINDSAFFIGVITNAGPPEKTSQVFSEFELANRFNKPAIFLIEDTVQVAAWISLYENTIRFNRRFPEQAINQVNDKISGSRNATWILAGIGILALLDWLSDQKK